MEEGRGAAAGGWTSGTEEGCVEGSCRRGGGVDTLRPQVWTPGLSVPCTAGPSLEPKAQLCVEGNLRVQLGKDLG